jgi:hypothetical protein
VPFFCLATADAGSEPVDTVEEVEVAEAAPATGGAPTVEEALQEVLKVRRSLAPAPMSPAAIQPVLTSDFPLFACL